MTISVSSEFGSDNLICIRIQCADLVQNTFITQEQGKIILGQLEEAVKV